MAKEVRFSKDARVAMMKGVDTLADAVKITLVRKAATSFWKEAMVHR